MTRSEPPADVIEAAQKLSAWFHRHYPVKWEHGGGLRLDAAITAYRLRTSSSLGGREGGVARPQTASAPDEPLITGKQHWQPMESAPKDGTWFLICRAGDAFDSYEVGCFEPLLHDEYVEVGDNLYRKEKKSLYDWRGFNNPHRATHWMPLPEPPK